MAKDNEFVKSAEQLQKKFKGDAHLVAITGGNNLRVSMEGNGADLMAIVCAIVEKTVEEMGPVAAMLLASRLAHVPEEKPVKKSKKGL